MRHWEHCTQKQRIERWDQVLRVLRSLTRHERRKHWDMGDFGRKTECGTVACAAGYCSLDPWFRRRGYTGEFSEDVTGAIKLVTGDEWGFFGHEGSDDIFYNPKPRSVGTVIKEILAYIKQLEAA